MGPIYSASANNIREWPQKEEDNMVCGFMHLLLFKEVPNDSNNQTNWQALRSKTETKEQPFLFFIDEVPSQDNDSDSFTTILFFRDFLRSLGICPILMSTHSGIENYEEPSSRGDDMTWVKIITRLPQYIPVKDLCTSHSAVFEETERPLVSVFAADKFLEGLTLAGVIKKIRIHVQNIKSEPWNNSPSLQLMQLFATKVVFGKGICKNAHHIVGKHFGSLVQAGSIDLTPDAAKHFKRNAKMSFVSGELEPLLYLALVSWDDSCFGEGAKFPLTMEGKAISVLKAFKQSKEQFQPWISIQNDQVNHADGDLLEVLVHASLTLASLKTDHFGDTFLGGVPLELVLCFVSKLMSEGNFDGNAELPNFLKELQYEWPIVPALGGSNSCLSSKINNVKGTNIGFLERPKNSAGTDGIIWNVKNEGQEDTYDITVECKNLKFGLTMNILQDIFKRIQPQVKCCLIFTSTLSGNLYSQTTRNRFDELMKDIKHEAFESRRVSVIVWDTKTDKSSFFNYKLKDESETSSWEAKGNTTLLVVIFLVGLVEAVSCLEFHDALTRKRKFDRSDYGKEFGLPVNT
jgi:hypothetical protein